MTPVVGSGQTELVHPGGAEQQREALSRAGIRPPTRPLRPRRSRVVVRERPRLLAFLYRLAGRIGL